MLVVFTKLSDEKHRLEVKRDDGSTESQELVTREFLLHDLVHLALEEEAAIDDGVWGSLAQGKTFAELNDRDALFATEGLRTAEALTGPMQAVYKGDFSRELYVQNLGRDYPFVTVQFVERVLERLRKLTGHFRGTRMRESMIVEFPERPC